MIEHTLDKAHSILYVRPQSKLEQGDFVQLAETVDPHIEARGALAGLIIEASAFPGWEGLSAQWQAIFDLCEIITSTSRRSAL
jgi:hypothetical protein